MSFAPARARGRSVFAAAIISLALVAPAAPSSAARAASDPTLACMVIPELVERCPTWVSTHDYPEGQTAGSFPDAALESVASPTGDRVFVAGEIWSSTSGSNMGCCPPPGGFDVGVVAYDPATGSKVWSTRWDGPTSVWDNPRGMAISPDGETVYVVGIENQQILAQRHITGDWMVLAFDAATGALRWHASHRVDAEIQRSEAFDVAVSPDSERVYVTGDSGPVVGTDITTDAVLIAYDAATGEETWSAQHGANDLTDTSRSVAVAPDGASVFVVNTVKVSAASSHTKMTTVAYEAADEDHLGERRWIAGFGSANVNMALYLEVSPDGSRVYASGQGDVAVNFINAGGFGGAGNGIHSDIATVAYDTATGSELWNDSYRGPAGAFNRPFGLVALPDGRVFVGGWSSGNVDAANAVDHHFVGIGYSPAGARAWATRYQAPGATANIPSAVAVAPDGSRLYVSGTGRLSLHTGGLQYADTVAYDTASGELAWTTRTSTDPGSGALFPAAMVALPGSIIVSGSVAYGGGTNQGDFVTYRLEA